MKITLVKDSKKIIHEIPDNWDSVSLSDYVKVIELSKQVGLRELEKVTKIIHILTDIKEEDLLRLSTNNVARIGGYITKLLQNLPEDELKHFITIDNIEYGFHPNISNITMGEWVDIDTYISTGVEKNLHKIMSVLYRPIIAKDGDKYRIEEYKPNKERQDLFLNNLMVGDFYGVSVFFSNLGKELLQSTLKSSMKQLKKNMKDL
tara:strand:+ start:242 stop:856 length:615 start_codon:yes stop_codon:yes gene_type:complete